MGLLFTSMLLVVPVQLPWCANAAAPMLTQPTSYIPVYTSVHRQFVARSPLPILQAAGG